MKHIIRKISALLLIIFISIIAIKGFYGRNPENIQSEHYRYFEIDLPSNASDIHIYEPKFYSRWKDDFVIIRYTIPGKEIDYFKKRVSEKYSNWEPLGEVFVGGRLFTKAEMPNAMIVQSRIGNIHRGFIINENEVICYYFST